MGKTSRGRNLQVVSWTGALALAAALQRMQVPLRSRLRAAFRRHNTALIDIGGDPLSEDWTKFRPLRLSREEDWSDWLAWLVEKSKSGRFAARLFGRSAKTSMLPTVTREERLQQHRVDLRIEWRGADARTGTESTAVEVKVGDRQFAKTKSAANAHRRAYAKVRCDDWILVPSTDREACAVAGVTALTWDDVAMALRQSLRNTRESMAWRIWARAFLGAVEQRLLGFPHSGEFDSALDVTACLDHLEATDGKRS